MNNIVILVGGKSHSGKGEFSKTLELYLRKHNANVIRCSLSTYIRKITEEDFYCSDMESVEARKFMGEVYRLGTEIYPFHMARRVWERDIIPNLKDKTNIIIIESFRELNNYTYYENLLNEGKISKIITVNITRPDFTVLNEEMKKHVSETDLDRFKFDFIITNDKDVYDLHKKVEEFTMIVTSFIDNNIKEIEYGSCVKIVKILDTDEAEHLIEMVGTEGYVVGKITYKGINRYKVLLDLETNFTAYFRHDELEVIQ